MTLLTRRVRAVKKILRKKGTSRWAQNYWTAVLNSLLDSKSPI